MTRIKSVKTIRGKLLVWFISTLTIVFVLLGSLVGLVMWQVIHDQIDHHLHSVVTEAKFIITDYEPGTKPERLMAYAQQQGMTISIIAGSGEPLLQTNSPDVAILSEQAMRELIKNTPMSTDAPAHFTVNNVRFATLPISLSSDRGLLAVGYSLVVVEQTFQKLFGLITLMLLIALGLVAYGIKNLLTRHLKPLETIAQEANMISAYKYLRYRVSENQETLELQSLAFAINSMLGKLEKFFKTEHQFFSDAAHTLKTPLAVARSYIDSSRLGKERQASLKVLDTANDTINDLILISRMNSEETVSKEIFSLSRVVENIGEIAKVLAKEKKIDITVDVVPGIKIDYNQQLIKKAISNLVQNAINYTPAKGKIFIKLTRNHGEVIFTVKDTGIGIAKKEKAKVFERFYRGLNVNTQGSGLGLAIVKAVVEASHGSICLRSKPGSGTTVILTLPAA